MIAVLVVSVLLPLGCLVAYGAYDYQRRIQEAGDVIDRLARVAEEEAVKVFDLNREIESRIVEYLGNDDEKTIRSHGLELHRKLRAIGGSFPQVAAIAIYSESGELLVTSRFYPAPTVSAKEREDFQAAAKSSIGPYFSMPTHSQFTGLDIFHTTLSRRDAKGRFLGVVAIALRRDYFLNFYRDLVNHDPSLALGLYRKDAKILARFPSEPAGFVVGSSTPFANALQFDPSQGHMRTVSTIDGAPKYVSFRRVGNYPLYVSAGVSSIDVRNQWFRHIALISVLTLIPCGAVWILIAFSLAQLRVQQLSWERWRTEVQMRLSAEASTRQLQRMGALGNLVANVAHDFNNMLMVVAANMALVRRKHYDDLRREILAIEHATAGAQALSRRLLSVSRKQPIKLESIDLNGWMTVTLSLINAAVGERIKLLTNVAADIWCVRADPMELEFALVNVAVNARDAMQAGGQFSIDCRNIRVEDPAMGLPPGEYVLITLTDDGDGMPATVLQRAFEPLFTTKERGSGTGLGLPQVLAACEQAGGSARIESRLGEGTRVLLYLPRYVSGIPATNEINLASGQALPEVDKTVLLVEDNEGVAAGIEAVLETFGCTVRHVTTGDAAHTVLEHGNVFDLVLSDIQMPGKLSGIDLAELVRKKWPDQRIALMTGYADELARVEKMDVKVYAKPFDMNELRSFIYEDA